MGKVYVIASGKGGTGKTMFSVNFGATLAKRGYKVVLVDMDMGLRNLDLYFGLEDNVVYDVYDVLTGLCKIKQALIKDRRFDGLYVMASSPNRSDGILTPLHMKVLSDKLKEEFDYVIIDGPSGIDDGLVLASAGADEAIIVINPEYASMRDGDNIDRQLRELGIEKRFLIINNLDVGLMEEGYTPALGEIMDMMSAELAGVIQQDQNIRISTNLGIPIVVKVGTYIEENFNNIADRITEETIQEATRETTQETI